MIAAHSPKYFVYMVPLTIVSSILPILYVYAPKFIIQGLIEKWDYVKIFYVVVGFCGSVLALKLISAYLNRRTDFIVEEFSGKMSMEIGETVMDLELADLEDTKESDNIRLAGNVSAVINIVGTIRSIIQTVITLIGYIVIISNINIVFFLVIAFIMAVKIVLTYWEYRYGLKIREKLAENDREGGYLTSICYFREGSAKELRVNDLYDWFLNKVKGFRNNMVVMQFGEFNKRFRNETINSAVYAASSFFILWGLVEYYLKGIITIADFTLYFTTITSVSSCLAGITDLFFEYNKQLKDVSDYHKLKKLSEKSNLVSDPTAHREPIADKIDLEFRDVWFKYPGSRDYVLKNINITIKSGEKLVIVGYNGNGKSTFIKLLCKFYKPTKGNIYCNGVDIWKIPNSIFYKKISAVFQDFSTLAFTMHENITMDDGEEDISDILEKVGLTEFIDSLPAHDRTYVSKKFSSDGIEISGGQSQKLALARALYKDTPILVLDEPTASLDIRAENDLYERFFALTAGKTSIFISHRLAATQIADAIAVFIDGEIGEYGSHKELIKKPGGVYADMFEKQREMYVEAMEKEEAGL